MSESLAPYLAIGTILFALGAIGFLTRRNLILMMLSAELMLHGVSLSFLGFGRVNGGMDGQVFTVFVLTVAACEAGLALAIILSLYQRTKSLDVDLWSTLREPDLPPESPIDEDEPPMEPPAMEFPSLTPAGGLPSIDADAPLEPQQAPPPRRRKGGSFQYGEPQLQEREA